MANPALPTHAEDSVFDDIYARGDRIMALAVATHVWLALLLAPFYQTWLVTAVTATLAAGAFWLCAFLWPRRFVTRCVAGISLQAFCALHIWQLQGMPEMHFFFFTSTTLMVAYQDARASWPGVVLIIIQHTIFGYLHNEGILLGFFPEEHPGFQKFFFHYGIALVQAGAASYCATLLRRRTLADARQVAQIRESEAALRRAQALLDSIVEHIPNMILVKDASDLRFVRFNRAGEELTGFPREALIGKGDQDLLPPEQAGFSVATDREVLASGRPLDIPEEPIRTREKGRRILHTKKIPLNDADGRPRYLLRISEDITDRKRAEARLRAQFAVTRILVESATVAEAAPRILAAMCDLGWDQGGMWLVDRERDVLRLAEVHTAGEPGTPAFERASRGLALARGEGLPGAVWASGMPHWVPDVATAANFPRAAAAAADGLRSGCALPIVADGEILGVMEWFSREPRPTDSELLEVMADMGTQIGQFARRRAAEEALRRSEDQLRQSQKLEAVGRLAGGIAHDFNNLLTAIIGYSTILLEELADADPRRGDVAEIAASATRAAGLTRQLLAFSRRQVLQPAVIDLNALVANLERMLRRVIGEDIDLALGLGADLGRVRADPGQIEQVIMNLVVNARDAMLRGGRLRLETANVRLDDRAAAGRLEVPPGDYVTLTVSDTGDGMDAETQARIFEPFFTTKPQGKGTGLGLAMVYGILKQSGGSVAVRSAPGQGAAFTIYLPRVAAEPAPAEVAPAEQAPPVGAETVLLVEDQEDVRSLTHRVLTRSGYRVLEARGGDEACTVARRHSGPIHLLVTDVVMPGISGRQVAERLQAAHPQLQVLYMSGYTDDAIVHHGVLDPGIAFLQKPFSPAVLRRKVREVLDGAVARSA